MARRRINEDRKKAHVWLHNETHARVQRLRAASDDTTQTILDAAVMALDELPRKVRVEYLIRAYDLDLSDDRFTDCSGPPERAAGAEVDQPAVVGRIGP